MKDKIALVTCFLDNCGACLQAYALADRIEKLSGKQCEIINYTEPTGYFSYGLSDMVKESGAYVALRGLLQKSYLDGYKTEKVRRSAFRKFRKQYLPIAQQEFKTYEELEKADLAYSHYVCGSDQVWNPTFYGKCNPAYYLKFVPEDVPKTAYAPSIGINDLPDYAKADFKVLLSRFRNISVREDRGVELVKQYAGLDAQWVCDPTMLLTGQQWDKLSAPRLHKKPYIFCYLFGDSPEYKQAVAYLSEKTGLDVVIIPFSKRDLSKQYRQILKAGPSEFISLIKNAEYILTDSFHASVFSVLFRKNFFTLLRHKAGEAHGMNSRIFSLLKMLGLESRCVSPDSLESFPITPVEDYEAVYGKLNAVRADSERFLKNALGGGTPHLCENCCGCGACAQICPRNAITMEADSRGFLYPKINQALCIGCKLCEKLCNTLEKTDKNAPMEFLSYQGPKEICMHSSSGGAAHQLARKAISQGYAVCGAVFSKDFSKVTFAVAESEAELEHFRNSKYIAVELGDIYQKVHDLLKKGKNALFFGLPCHVAGLKAYFQNKKEVPGQLITVDLLCHGVGAPHIWNLALDEFCRSKGADREDLEQVNFRSKPEKNGKRLLLLLQGASYYLPAEEFPYYYGFTNRLLMRNSCYACQYRSVDRPGDLTLGDMIPIDPEGLGRSVICVNTSTGRELLENVEGAFVSLIDEEVEALKKRICNGHLNAVPKYRAKVNPQTAEEYRKLSGTYLNPAYVPLKYKILRTVKKIIRK